jgi:crotonobetainyl-CoA:carnitine CoA-transferase CaiB-like acyl-CoA transferase
VSLTRPDDRDAVPAVTGAPNGDPWAALEHFAAATPAAVVADRAQLVGVPAAALGTSEHVEAVRTTPIGRAGPRRDRPVVVDLSVMWAGPLCAFLLGRAGARVIKVETPTRPDGARRGEPRFYDWLHAGHEAVAVDLRWPEFRALIETADVVIEASRPRALRQVGIVAEDVIAAHGTTWVSITGYGRDGDAAERVAFGDDAAVGGGLVARDDAGEPVFCADAIADPLTGLCAAAAALDALTGGGGCLLDVAMTRVAASVAQRAACLAPTIGPTKAPVLPPRVPAITGAAPPLGAHTRAVMAELTAA